MILCFSGTGNSRYIAKKIADELQDEIVDMNAKIKATDYSPMKTGRNIIVVVPTYAWRIPQIVSEWLCKTELLSAERIWFVMDCGGEIGNAAKYNRHLAEQNIYGIWVQLRLLCRKIILLCLVHRKQKKQERLLEMRNLLLWI